jgi:hypothetical protein
MLYLIRFFLVRKGENFSYSIFQLNDHIEKAGGGRRKAEAREIPKNNILAIQHCMKFIIA